MLVDRAVALLLAGLRFVLLGALTAAPFIHPATIVHGVVQDADPLPSWTDGPVKRQIIDFVHRVTTRGGPEFVSAEHRFATFDNDGTLWAEKPLPTELFFALGRLEQLARKDSSLTRRQPFKAALERDAGYFQQAGVNAV